MCQLFHDKHTEEYYNYCNIYREISVLIAGRANGQGVLLCAGSRTVVILK